MVETRAPDARTPVVRGEPASLSKLDMAMAWAAVFVLLAAIAVTIGAVFAT